MNDFLFPENSQQLKYLKDFYFIVYHKYTFFKNNFKIIKNKNSTYERLVDTKKRGKTASIELINEIVKDCNLPVLDQHHLELLYQLQHTKCVREKDGVYFVIGCADYFKEFKIFNDIDQGMDYYLGVIKNDIEQSNIDQDSKIESILCLLGTMSLSKTEIMKIIHFLAHNFK
tara:strand:- start:5316 stop:5831 length:516 start_codon:yes stop_codon:yes gene_type:complete